MPDYYNPYRRQSSSNRYAELGSGYRQDLTTGQVERYTPGTSIQDRQRRRAAGYYNVEDPTEDLYEQRFARENQFKRNLSLWDQEARKFSDEAMRGFRDEAELGAARQLGGIMSN